MKRAHLSLLVRNLMRRIPAYGVGIAGLVAAGIVTLLVVQLDVFRRTPLPYHDRFALNRMEEWSTYGGSWQIVDGAVSNNSDDAGSKMIAGVDSLTDYVMHADVSLTSSFGDTGVVVRVTSPESGTNAFNGYYVGIRLPDQLLLGKMDYGFRPLVRVRTAVAVRPNEWYHLSVTVKGCHLAALAYDAQGTLVAHGEWDDEDACDRHGAFGLRSFAAGGRWRNVSVEALR